MRAAALVLCVLAGLGTGIASGQDLAGSWIQWNRGPHCDDRVVEILVWNQGDKVAHDVVVESSLLGLCDGAEPGGQFKQRWDGIGTPGLRTIAPGDGIVLHGHTTPGMPTSSVTASIRARDAAPVDLDQRLRIDIDCHEPQDHPSLRLVDLDGGDLLPGDRVRLDVHLDPPKCGYSVPVWRRLTIPAAGLVDLVPDRYGFRYGSDVMWDQVFPDDVSLTARIDPDLSRGASYCVQGAIEWQLWPYRCPTLHGTDDPDTSEYACATLGMYPDPTCRVVGSTLPGDLLRDATIASLEPPIDLGAHLPLAWPDDAYREVSRGDLDPDPVVADASRPLVLYSLRSTARTLRLARDGASVRIAY